MSERTHAVFMNSYLERHAGGLRLCKGKPLLVIVSREGNPQGMPGAFNDDTLIYFVTWGKYYQRPSKLRLRGRCMVIPGRSKAHRLALKLTSRMRFKNALTADEFAEYFTVSRRNESSFVRSLRLLWATAKLYDMWLQKWVHILSKTDHTPTVWEVTVLVPLQPIDGTALPRSADGST